MTHESLRLPRVLLAGIGGYGTLYTDTLIDMQKENKIIIAGMADPYLDSCQKISKVKEAGIPLYTSTSQFWDAGNKADITMIASPIAFHTKQIMEALSHGTDVLCEKPLSGDYRDGAIIESLAGKAGKFVMIGYQWSYSKAISSLKADILAGIWGKPIQLKTLVLWPRPVSYFKRGSGWAGRKYDADGTPVFDSVINNATAHYLHNILYILGNRFDTALIPETVEVQLSRANEIENFDNAAVRCSFDNGAEALFLASHCTDRSYDPAFVYKFENGTVTFDETNNGEHCITGTLKNGSVIRYGDPFEDSANKIRLAIENVKTKDPYLPCNAKTAVPHSAVISAVQKTRIFDIPETLKSNKDTVVVSGLYELMTLCYRQGKMPAETGIDSGMFAAPETVRIDTDI
ncbi:MAG: Gfo/Idh/MocA family protein [Eubacteriales bacterium]